MNLRHPRSFFAPFVLLTGVLSLAGCADGGGPSPESGDDDALTTDEVLTFDVRLDGAFTPEDESPAASDDEMFRAQLPYVLAALAKKGVTLEVTGTPTFVQPDPDTHWKRTRWTVTARGRATLASTHLGSIVELRRWSTSAWAPGDGRGLRTHYGDSCMDTSAPEHAADIDDAAYAVRFDGWIRGCWAWLDFAVLEVKRVDGHSDEELRPDLPLPSPDPEGWIRHDVDVQSEHPYRARTSFSQSVAIPWELRYRNEPIRIRIERLELAPGDYLSFWNEARTANYEYSGTGRGLVTRPMTPAGLSVFVENLDESVAWGYHISAYYTRAPSAE